MNFMNKAYQSHNYYALKLLILLVSGNLYATNYIFDGTLTPAFGTFPNQAFIPNNGDTLDVQSGNMHLDVASSGTILTTGNGISYSVTIQPGATVTNTMPTGNSGAIALNASAGSNITINNKGTIEQGAAAHAVYIDNTNSSNRVSLINSGVINGSIYMMNANIYIDDIDNATGNISTANANVSIFIGANSTANHTISAEINQLDEINVISGTLNINAQLRNMNGNFNTSSNTTTNVNAQIAAYQNLNNDGDFIIASNLLIQFGFGTVTNNGNISINSAGKLAFDSMTSSGDVTLNGASIESYNIGVTPNIINSGNMTTNDASNIISGMSNTGTLNIYGTLGGLNNLTNSGTMNLQGDINMAGYTFTNTGTLKITGNRTINSSAIISTGAQNYLITDATTYDSLTSTGSINLNNGTINITSNFIGATGSSLHWDILTGTAIATNSGTVINVPASGAFGVWSENIIGGNILRIVYTRNNNSNFVPPTGTPTQIADVINNMSNGTKNAGQTALLQVINTATTQAQSDYILTSLEPNTTTSNINIAIQNIGFNKVETRLTKAKFNNKIVKNNQRLSTIGIATGDLTSNSSMWASGLGSISKQKNNGDNQGYRAKTLGGMLGFDIKDKNDDIFGLALGLSNANVYALINTTNNTRVLNYNLMVYGANTLPDYCAAQWLEWIISGVINKNYGVRVFGLNGTDLSTSASYRSVFGGGKINVGKNYNLNNMWNLSPVATAQYILVHQPAYNEDNSVAALHVATRNNQSILTFGAGARLGMFKSDSNLWLYGVSDLSAMITCDVLSPKQITTANFVVGSDSFVMASTPARLALRLGADYGLKLYKDLDLEFSYNYEIRSGYYNNFGEIKFRYLF